MRFAGAVAMAAALFVPLSAAAQRQAFHLEEATIAGIHAAFASGTLTCVQLTNLYLARIEAYNLKGPAALRAILTVNPEAVATAEKLFIIDPFSCGPLDRFWEILSDPAKTVVLHAGREDIRICHFAAGKPPANVFDIQLAAGA